MDRVVPEVTAGVAELEEHRVCEGLPRERGTSCPEGDGNLMLAGNRQDPANLILCVHLQRHLGTEQKHISTGQASTEVQVPLKLIVCYAIMKPLITIVPYALHPMPQPICSN